MSSQGSDITLYTTQTPNGIKISITLEELGYVHMSEIVIFNHNPTMSILMSQISRLLGNVCKKNQTPSVMKVFYSHVKISVRWYQDMGAR
jgi:hypothetical protein